MQCVIKYVNSKDGRIIKYGFSKDIDKDLQSFDDRKKDPENKRRKYIQNIYIEIVEETDEPERAFLRYVLPEASRVNINDSILEHLDSTKNINRVINAVNWASEIFLMDNYNLYFSYVEYEENDAIALYVYKDGSPFEKYIFTGSCKSPYVRSFV